MPKYWGEELFRTREFPRSGSKAKNGEEKKRKNTPGTAGGPGMVMEIDFILNGRKPKWKTTKI